MGQFCSYEIQTYARGAWRIETICDDPDIAIFEAKRVFQRGHYVAVRVVEERCHPVTNEAVVKTVFRVSKADQRNAQTRARQNTARAGAPMAPAWAAAGASESETCPEHGDAMAGSSAGAVLMVLILAALLLTGIGAVLTLRYLFGAL